MRAWLLWVGMFVLSTVVLRAYRDGTDVVYAVLTYLLVVLGGSVSGGRPLGFALTAAGVGSIDFFFQLPYNTLAVGGWESGVLGKSGGVGGGRVLKKKKLIVSVGEASYNKAC